LTPGVLLGCNTQAKGAAKAGAPPGSPIRATPSQIQKGTKTTVPAPAASTLTTGEPSA